jgi:hypothetical protein
MVLLDLVSAHHRWDRLQAIIKETYERTTRTSDDETGSRI